MKTNRWFAVAGLLVLVVTTPSIGAQKTTAKEIVSRCAEAMGGRGRIDALKTLRITMVYPDHEGTIRTEIKRPNRSRSGDVLVFDGERAAFLDRGSAADGTRRPAELVDPEEWKDFEMVIGFSFPAFFDYPPEYLGMVAIEGIETHKLGVNLPMGGRLIYYVEAATNLPLLVESYVTMRGNTYRSQRILMDYRESEGILYPHAFTYYSPKVRKMFTVTLETLELNPPLHDDRFKVPAQLLQAN